MSWHFKLAPSMPSHPEFVDTDSDDSEIVSSRCSPRCATRGERGSGSERPTNGARAGHPRGRARDTRAPAQAPRAPAVDSRVALREGCLGGCSKNPIRASRLGATLARVAPRLRRPLAPTPRTPRAPRYLHAVLTPLSPVPPVPPSPFADPPELARRPIVPGRVLPGFPVVAIAEADQPPAPRRHASRRRRAVPARRRQVAGLSGVHVRRRVPWWTSSPVASAGGVASTCTHSCARSSRAWGGSGRWCPPPRGCSRRCSCSQNPPGRTARGRPRGCGSTRRAGRGSFAARRGSGKNPESRMLYGERVVSRRRAQTQAPTRTTNRRWEEG